MAKPIAILTVLLFFSSSPTLLAASKNPIDFIVAKAKTYGVIMVGTKHRQPVILDFIAELLPELPAAGITHIGLEIATDQQESIDRFIDTGQGLNKIGIDPLIDCPGYRRNLELIRTLNIKIIALDLPKSMWNSEHSRDRWMATTINSLFLRHPGAKILAILGNLHTLNQVEWTNPAIKDKSIRAYLRELRPGLTVYSIAQVISEQSPGCEFAKKFGGSGSPTVVETDGLDLRLGLLDIIAAEPMTAKQAVDAVIVH